MKFFRPHSFFTLLLSAFFFVCLPLLAALFSSVQLLEGLTRQSVAAVYSSVDSVTRSRKVADLLRDEERKARQYNVLGDPVQLEEVNKTHDEIAKTLEFFAHLDGDDQLGALIDELQSKENYIIAVLNRVAGDPEQHKKEREYVLSMYQEIGNLALSLVRLSNQLMLNEVEGLKLQVSQGKKKLIWQTSGLISFTILFGIVFMILIFKPVRQIDKSIELLGTGDFATPIAVSGPQDLEALGEKLDWLRKRLAKLDMEKVKLIAHISHDLKTPLASIKEGAGLLRDELVGPMNDSQKEVVRILDSNCTKLQKLIENILNFNMAGARNMPLEKKSVRLDELIEEVVTDQHHSILAGEIRLDLHTTPLSVDGNRKQLKTVFDNLVSNAVKFTPDRGFIRITLKGAGKNALFLIEDSGPGIREEERSRIFSPFFQGSESARSVVKGSGLGLAISREYVQYHGGSIRLLSGRRGARFAVTLPLGA
ncbi:MAG TPA: sensor histidine kinase [Desulfobacteraceae bacterium]|nr:sensor histidine kinase [Desulfobacteraceae bacterium]